MTTSDLIQGQNGRRKRETSRSSALCEFLLTEYHGELEKSGMWTMREESRQQKEKAVWKQCRDEESKKEEMREGC